MGHGAYVFDPSMGPHRCRPSQGTNAPHTLTYLLNHISEGDIACIPCRSSTGTSLTSEHKMCASERPLPPAACRSSTFAAWHVPVRGRRRSLDTTATTALAAVDEEAGTKAGTDARRHRRRRDRKRKRSDGECRGNANVTGTALGLLSLAGLCCLLGLSYGGDSYDSGGDHGELEEGSLPETICEQAGRDRQLVCSRH